MSSLALLLACTDGPGTTGDLGHSDPNSPNGATDTGTETIPGASSTDTWQPFALLTLNLHCFKLDGTQFGSTSERFAAIAAEVADQDVAVIAAQEACVSATEGDAMALLASALHDATGESWGTAWLSTHTAWEGTEDEADEGVGVLVRGAEIEGQSLDYSVQASLYRRAIAVVLPDDLGGLQLLSTHLDYEDADVRRMQARQSAIFALVSRTDLSVLLAGDFNTTVGSDPLLDLSTAGFDRLSEAADVDGTLIDHIFAPATAPFQVTDARVLFDSSATAVSDHPGVLVNLAQLDVDPQVRTHLIADVDVGFGHYLALRGDSAPLDWELGWPAVNTGDTRWEAALVAWDGSYKWLLDDQSWESGDDHTTTAGAEDLRSPTF